MGEAFLNENPNPKAPLSVPTHSAEGQSDEISDQYMFFSYSGLGD